MKKIFSFVIVLAAVAMVSCCGNSNKPAEAEVVATEATACEGCAEKCDSTAACAEADSTACATPEAAAEATK